MGKNGNGGKTTANLAQWKPLKINITSSWKA